MRVQHGLPAWAGNTTGKTRPIQHDWSSSMRFGATSSQPKKQSRLKWIRQNIGLATTYFSMWLAAASGLCLLGSGGLSLVNSHRAQQPPAAAALETSETPTQTATENTSKKTTPAIQSVELEADQLVQIQKLLQKLGMTFISISYTTGVLGEIGASIKRGQPSYALGNILFIPLIPLFYMFPDSTAVRGLVPLLLGVIYSGYANEVKNLYEKKDEDGSAPDNAPQRSCPLATMVDGDTWKTLLSSPESRKALGTETVNALKYMAGDQGLVLLSAKNAPKTVVTTVRDVFKGAWAMLTGNKLDIPPDADRMRFSALCSYVGGLILVLTGNPWGAIVAGAGTTMRSLESFSIGTQRDDWIGTALKWGAPLQCLGDSFIQTDAGYGARNLGEASTYTLTIDLYSQPDTTSKDKPNSEAASD